MFKRRFSLLTKKYQYVVICLSDGTYNPLIYILRRKCKFEELITRYATGIRFFHPQATVYDSMLWALFGKETSLNEIILAKLINR